MNSIKFIDLQSMLSQKRLIIIFSNQQVVYVNLTAKYQILSAMSINYYYTSYPLFFFFMINILHIKMNIIIKSMNVLK